MKVTTSSIAADQGFTVGRKGQVGSIISVQRETCQFLAAALVYRTVGRSETDMLLFAGCLMMAGFAFALGLAFRKSGAPTWKHRLAVAVVALPAAISLLLR